MRSVQPPPAPDKAHADPEYGRLAAARVGMLVTGSRNWRWPAVANQVLRWPGGPVTLVHGGAEGADKQMMRHAADQGWHVEPPFLPIYGAYGRSAPLRRNEAMIKYLLEQQLAGTFDVVMCVALWRDHSSGTGHARRLAREAGFTVITRFDCGCHDLIGRPVR